MNWLKYQLALMSTPDVILHIGAGLCSELPDYQQINPGRIILIEPSPETFNALRQQTADCDNVTVLQAAVADEAGRTRLHRFNFPELDSLREPTGLYRVLPGLQQIGETEVPTISPSQLMRRLSLEESTYNWLVVETPGQDAAVIEELNRIEALQNFSRVIIRTCAEPLYKGESSADPLLELLESLGYFIEGSPDKDDADWPRYHLKFQPLALKCRDLETRLGESQQHLDRSSEESRAKSEEVDALNSRIEKLEKQRHQLESARRELSEQAEASAHELESANQQRTQLEQKIEEKSAQAEKLKKSGAELKTAKEHYEKLATEQSRQLEERQKQHTELDERQRLLDTEVQRAEAQIDLIKDVLIREKNF